MTRAWHVGALALSLLMSSGCDRDSEQVTIVPQQVQQAQQVSPLPPVEAEPAESKRERGFDSLAVGDSSACWIRDDGRLVCFGLDYDGSLGGAVAGVPQGAPRVVPGLPELVAIAGYEQRRCAIDVAGEVWCFGPMQLSRSIFWTRSPPRHVRMLADNLSTGYAVDGEGRLLRYDPSSRKPTPEPTPEWRLVEGIEGVVEFEMRSSTGCGRTEAGTIQCFHETSEPPSRVAHISGLDPIDIGERLLVLDRSGVVFDIVGPDPKNPAWKIVNTGVRDVVALDDSCGLHSDGAVTCELHFKPERIKKQPPARAIAEGHDGGVCTISASDDSVYCSLFGRSARRVQHLSPAQSLAAPWERWCALVDEQVRCINDRGAKLTVPELRGEELVAAHRTVCVREGGRVRCWDGEQVFDAPLDDAIALVRIGYEACARRADGSLLCLAHHAYGELNTGPVAGLQDVVEVALGAGFACAREHGGQVRCWGVHGEQGQLGDGLGRSTLTPSLVAGIDDAVDIDVGARTACAVRSTGEVMCWGVADPNASATSNQKTPQLLEGITDAVEVSVDLSPGHPAVCVRHRDGRVSCPRGNFGCDQGREQPPSELGMILGISDAIHIDSGHGFACAVLSSREVACWGHDYTIGSTRACGAPPTRFAMQARGIGLDNGWLCVDLVDERQPTCWGLRGHGDRKPGVAFPFADALEPATQSPDRSQIETISVSP